MSDAQKAREETPYDRMFDAGFDSPFVVNEYGIWCPECGDDIARPHFFDEGEDYVLPECCRDCGFPHD